MKPAHLLLATAMLMPQAAPARTLGEIEFKSCELGTPGRRALVRAECARLDVPENPADPDGRKIGLALALVRSRASEPLPDPVVVLAGGPGQSARDAYLATAQALDPLRRDRNIVLVDQRGTGGSNRLPCATPDWKEIDSFSVDDARRMAAECRAELEPRADLRFYTTGHYIGDLETVRKAIGAPRVNLVGGSYGTRVALDYLRRHPDAIRSVFIDSVAPPELPLLQDHARNLDNVLEAISGRCQSDGKCKERFGDPLETLRTLHARLDSQPARVSFRDPLTHESVTALLSGDVLGMVVRLLSYSPQMASLLPLIVDEAANGRHGPLLALAEQISGSLGEALAHGMELSVICAEDVPWLTPDERDADTLMGAELVQYTRAQCEVWPRGGIPDDFKEPVISDKPVLLLSGEFDPVTPPRYAERVARTLSNSRHLVAPGQGHTPMNEGCMPKLLARFVDELKPAELDASCLDTLGVSPFFLGYEGPAP